MGDDLAIDVAAASRLGLRTSSLWAGVDPTSGIHGCCHGAKMLHGLWGWVMLCYAAHAVHWSHLAQLNIQVQEDEDDL